MVKSGRSRGSVASGDGMSVVFYERSLCRPLLLILSVFVGVLKRVKMFRFSKRL